MSPAGLGQPTGRANTAQSALPLTKHGDNPPGNQECEKSLVFPNLTHRDPTATTHELLWDKNEKKKETKTKHHHKKPPHLRATNTGTESPFSPCLCPTQEAPEGAEGARAAAANSSFCKSRTGRDFKTSNFSISGGSPDHAEGQQCACRKEEAKPRLCIQLPHRLEPLGTQESVEQELSSWRPPLRFPEYPAGPQLPGTL